MRLRFDERRQILKLTHPRALSARKALSWAAEQKDWVGAQIVAQPAPEPLVPGAVIPIEGEDVALCWIEAFPRAPRLSGGRLVAGGPASGFARRIELFLKSLARERLSAETAELAQAAGLRAVSVTVGDAATRWGSCSSAGRIRYSWRLILAPPQARRLVVAHEVAHLRELNHGAAFKRLERELFGGDVAPARSLLRRLGPRLRRIGLRS